MAHDPQSPTEDLLQQAIYLHLDSLSLLYALKKRLEQPEPSKRRKGTTISVPTRLAPFEPPQPPNKNEPPFVPEGLYVICMRCAYQWLPRHTRRPKGCPSCNSPWWYPARTAEGKERKVPDRLVVPAGHVTPTAKGRARRGAPPFRRKGRADWN